ncbi:pyocin knob domain-containing protein [Candidatus Pacearchaeota archaeon]|nr:pyocin knob domain-containing protein [Candidatus Pacearchaeota archaeon]
MNKKLYLIMGILLLFNLILVSSASYVSTGDVYTGFSWDDITNYSIDWNEYNGNLFYNNGNIGLGTHIPNSKLEVIGDINVTGNVYGGYFVGDGSGITNIGAGSIDDVWVNESGDTMTGNLNINANLTVDTSDFFVNSNTGNVGIGTTSPGSTLQVHKNAGSEVAISHGSSGTAKLFVGYDSTGSGGTRQGLEIFRNYGDGNIYFNNTQLGDLILNPNGGNVGIGTSSPDYPFQVQLTEYSGVNFYADSGSPTLWISAGDSKDAQQWYRVDGPQYWTTGVDYSDSAKFKIVPSTTISTATGITIDTSGNTGIGTTTPQQKLHVSGNAVVNGTINMDSNKIISLANGTSAQDAVTYSQLQESVGSGFSGSGTTNYIPKFTGSTALGDSVIYETGGNIGIGTTSPGDYHSYADNLVIYENGNSGITIGSETNSRGQIFFANDTNNDDSEWRGFLVYDHSDDSMWLGAGGATVMHLEGGNVGIGDTTPAAELDVGGGTANYIDGANDLLVADDLEVDGTIYGDGSGITNIGAGSIDDVWVNESGDTMSGNLNMGVNSVTGVYNLIFNNEEFADASSNGAMAFDQSSGLFFYHNAVGVYGSAGVSRLLDTDNVNAGDHLTLTDNGDSGSIDLDVDDDFVLNTGDTMTGALNMNNNLITNIGNAGTDFTSGGGLTLAGTFDPNGAITLPTTGISGAGSGSGLDADLLDGQEGSYYATAGDLGNYLSDTYLNGRSIGDANSADDAGVTAYYLTSGASNKPSGTDHSLFTLSYSNVWSTQMAADWRTNNWYVREQNSGVWGAWDTIWTSGNDGTSSGLDADLLDGYNSATAATANTIALRDANADITQRYGHASYFSMSHSAATRNSDTVFYSSTDNYIRKNTAAGMRTSLGLTAGGGGDIWVEKAGDTMTGTLFIYGDTNGLRVQHAGAANSFWFNALDANTLGIGGTGGTEPAAGAINIQFDGDVGIGTTSPATPGLHIVSGAQVSNPALLRVQSATQANSDYEDVYAGIEFGVKDGQNSAGTQQVSAYIKSVDTRAGSTSYDDGGLAFGTLTSSEASPSTKMILTATGDVGIGDTTPSYDLDVASNIRAQGNLYVGTGGGYFYSDTGSRVRIDQDFYTNNGNTYLYGDNTYLGAPSGDTILFRGNTVTADSWGITSGGAGTFTTIDTGNGAMEVNSIAAYLGNQNLRTTDSPTFGDITLTGTINAQSTGAHIFGSGNNKITLDPSGTTLMHIATPNGAYDGILLDMDDDQGSNNFYALNIRLSDTPQGHIDNTNTKFLVNAEGNLLINYGTTLDTGYWLDVNGAARFTSTLESTTIDTGSGAKELGDAAVADGDTNSIPTGDQVYDFVTGQGYLTSLSGAILDASPGNWEVASNVNDDIYHAASLELREYNLGGAQTGAYTEAPSLSFHWDGRVASQIMMGTSGDIEIRDNPGTGYETLRAGEYKVGATSVIDSSRNIVNAGTGTFSGNIGTTGVDITSGDNRGIHFWNGAANYAVYMSDADPDLGGVTTYSITSKMNDQDTRGFRWCNENECGMSLESYTGQWDLAVANDINLGGELSTLSTSNMTITSSGGSVIIQLG